MGVGGETLMIVEGYGPIAASWRWLKGLLDLKESIILIGQTIRLEVKTDYTQRSLGFYRQTR